MYNIQYTHLSLFNKSSNPKIDWSLCEDSKAARLFSRLLRRRLSSYNAVEALTRGSSGKLDINWVISSVGEIVLPEYSIASRILGSKVPGVSTGWEFDSKAFEFVF